MAYSAHDLPVNDASISTVQGTVERICAGYQFLMVLNGEMEIRIGDERQIRSRSDVLMLPVGTRYRLSAKGSNLLLLLELRADFFSLGQSEQRGRFYCDSASDPERDYEAVRGLVSRIAMLYLEKNDINHLHLHELCYSLVFYLNRYHYSAAKGQNGSLRDERIARITSYIEHNYAQPITLRDLSEELHLATTYVSKYFKQSLGVNFFTYLNQVRLRHSLSDLLASDQSVTAVSFNNGFPSPSAFIKAFKDAYGTTPNQYRRSALRETAPGHEDSGAMVPMDPAVGKEYLDLAGPAAPQKEKGILYPNEKEIVVKNIKSYHEVVPLWRSMINIGFSKSVADSGMRDQLALAQKAIGFRYCRLQGMLSSDLLPRLPDGSGFNFSEFDRFMEFLLPMGLIPFLDLTYRKHHLFYTPGEFYYTGGSDAGATSEERFLSDVSLLIRHCVNTFGDGAVNSWAFEINYRHDEALNPTEAPTAFVRRLGKTCSLIRSYCPNALVGGVGHNTSISPAMFSGILDAMDREGVSPDFISLSVYPFDPCNGSFVVTANPDFAARRIDDLRAILSKHKTITQRLFVTTFGADVSARNYVNDTCHQATFLAKHTIDLLDKVEVLGYWQLSDLETRHTDTTRMLFGGNGILSKDGIKKPGFSVLELLRNVSPYLIEKGPGYLVTTNTLNIHHVVLYNYAHFNEVYRASIGGRVTVEDAYSSFQNPETKIFSITLSGLPTGNYKVVTTTLSRTSGSLFDAWVQYGWLEDLQPTELQYFRDVIHPHRIARHMVCSDSTLTLRAQLLPHEIKVLTIIRALDG